MQKCLVERGFENEIIDELLRFDYLSSDNSKTLPKCLPKHFSKDFKKLETRLKIDCPSYNFFRFSINPETLEKGDFAVGFDYAKKDRIEGLYPHKIIALYSCKTQGDVVS
jgi:hypothetical protein